MTTTIIILVYFPILQPTWPTCVPFVSCKFTGCKPRTRTKSHLYFCTSLSIKVLKVGRQLNLRLLIILNNPNPVKAAIETGDVDFGVFYTFAPTTPASLTAVDCCFTDCLEVIIALRGAASFRVVPSKTAAAQTWHPTPRFYEWSSCLYEGWVVASRSVVLLSIRIVSVWAVSCPDSSCDRKGVTKSSNARYR